jgi:rRNA-processing protein EBP2
MQMHKTAQFRAVIVKPSTHFYISLPVGYFCIVKSENLIDNQSIQSAIETTITVHCIRPIESSITMAPKNNKAAKKAVKKTAAPAKVVKKASKITLEELDAISSDEEGGPSTAEDEWDAEALALRQAIKEGAFDHLLEKSGNDDDEEEIKEVSLEDNMEDEDEPEELVDMDDKEDDEEGDDEEDEDAENDDDNSDAEVEEAVAPDWGNGKALLAVTKEVQATKLGMPWAESFSIIAETPLPFGTGAADGNPLDVHDDLKRELAFYNMALEAANMARKKCLEANVPFTRPEDFFAEMLKTDGE